VLKGIDLVVRQGEVCVVLGAFRLRQVDLSALFQRFNLFPHMTALENVMEAPCRVKKEPKGQVRKRALALPDRVVVTHAIGFAREVDDSLVFMDGGVVVESGPPREVISEPKHERTKAFLAKVLHTIGRSVGSGKKLRYLIRPGFQGCVSIPAGLVEPRSSLSRQRMMSSTSPGWGLKS
jgi:ABC-type sugar transport system ATPase subunit